MVVDTVRGYAVTVCNGDTNPATRHWMFPPTPESPRASRELVARACRDWGVDSEACEDARLIATELVANVVDHAGTDCTLTFSLDDAGLRVEVRDFYPCPPPRPRPFDMNARRGRGLQVVSMLSIRWGVNEFADGKSVWAVLPGVVPVSAEAQAPASHPG